MSKVAVIDSETHVVESIIKAKATDPPYENTYFVAIDPDEVVTHGMIYDPVAKTFELSPEQIKELEDQFHANLASLQASAWTTSSQ